MDTREFLQSVAGYARAQDPEPPRVKLATVDTAYDPATYPATLPKVTFDGESTLSGKRYPVVGAYHPYPSDRVALIPVGTTYAIVGSVDSDASERVGGNLVVTGTITSGGRDVGRARLGTKALTGAGPTSTGAETALSAWSAGSDSTITFPAGRMCTLGVRWQVHTASAGAGRLIVRVRKTENTTNTQQLAYSMIGTLGSSLVTTHYMEYPVVNATGGDVEASLGVTVQVNNNGNATIYGDNAGLATTITVYDEGAAPANIGDAIEIA